MKILHIIPSVDPRGGGPIEGVRRIAAERLKTGGLTEVACLDAPGEPFLSDFPGRVHALGPGLRGYRYSSKLVPWLRENRRRFDAVVVNGLWQYHGFAAWLALAGTDTPYFVFTHGMLDPWFKRSYPLKHAKKWLYWPWADYRLLRDARAVLFTCEEERRLSKQSFWLYRCREVVASYGTAAPPDDGVALAEEFFEQHPALRSQRLLLFLSRIHEKKGCDLLIEAFARVAQDHDDLHLLIAGPDQAGWKAELQALASKLGVSDRITWPGMLQGRKKWGCFYAAEAFCLPSHQENFGIVVAEALGCGKPVLISDKVNIWREVHEDGAGIVGSDTLNGTAQTLRQWLGLPAIERDRMALAAKGCFETRFSIEKVVSHFLEIINQGISSASHRDGSVVS